MKIMDSYFKLLLNRVGTIHNTISRKAIIKINHKSKGKKQRKKKHIYFYARLAGRRSAFFNDSFPSFTALNESIIFRVSE